MKIETDRLVITEFSMDIAQIVHEVRNLPVMAEKVRTDEAYGICLNENTASKH